MNDFDHCEYHDRELVVEGFLDFEMTNTRLCRAYTEMQKRLVLLRRKCYLKPIKNGRI